MSCPARSSGHLKSKSGPPSLSLGHASLGVPPSSASHRLSQTILCPPSFREAAIGRHEPLQHRTDQARNVAQRLPGFAAEDLGIGHKIAVERRRQLHRYLYGLVVRSEEHTSELQSLMRISFAV